jgi:hypothetical protein
MQNYFKKSLKLKDAGGLLSALGPLAGNGDVFSYDKDAVAVALVKLDAPVTAGELFVKLAILTK